MIAFTVALLGLCLDRVDVIVAMEEMFDCLIFSARGSATGLSVFFSRLFDGFMYSGRGAFAIERYYGCLLMIGLSLL